MSEFSSCMCFVSVNYESATTEPWITIIAILIILAIIILVILKRRRLWSLNKTWKTASVIAKGEEEGIYLGSSNNDKVQIRMLGLEASVMWSGIQKQF